MDEQIIWFFFSVLTVMITLGALYTLFDYHDNSGIIDQALVSLEQQCVFSCNSHSGTRLPTTVTFLSDSLVYTKEDRICIDYDEEKKCVLCPCQVQPFLLNLSGDFAQHIGTSIEYSCYFEREPDYVTIDCQG
ncbi:hypothetical protein H6504_01970 [Candidatus Woesearchaeota archaeon]|nr:hypothetical protein [Candidatus Woesearchaeota archaeon]